MDYNNIISMPIIPVAGVAGSVNVFITVITGVVGSIVDIIIGIIVGVLAALISSVIASFFVMFPLLTALAGFILMFAAFRRKGNRRTRR